MDTSMEKIKTVVTEKYEFEYRDESILIATLEFSDYQDSNARNKINNFIIEQFITNKTQVENFPLRPT